MEADGDKVFALFKKSEPDVCVLDVMLPNKDGFEIAEEIRGVNETVPILFVTAKTQTNDVVKGFSLGGNDYIRKPFSMEELIVRIHNALRMKQEDGPKKITGDSVQIGRYNFHLNRQVLNDGKQEKKIRIGFKILPHYSFIPKIGNSGRINLGGGIIANKNLNKSLIIYNNLLFLT